MLRDKPVTFSLHTIISSSREVINEPDLIDLSEEELLKGFGAERITAVQSINIRCDNKDIPTRNIILPFNSTSRGNKSGYLRCKIRLYRPNPLRCFNCQWYGHGAKTCRGKATCSKCRKDIFTERRSAQPERVV